ncbi:MAG: alpha-1,2-fucosyltransferase [Methanomassiliicoccales archaeon]|nr:alpha-1,2-fucosyltransferase [Methanomassiliicoccales archaeon]
MIIARIRGRLGNQLFQYAMARSLAWERETELRLDLTHFLFEGYECRLPAFKTNLRLASLSDISCPVLTSHLVRAAGRMSADGAMERLDAKATRSVPRFSKRAYIRERTRFIGYDEQAANSILTSGGDIYLDGFWQSEKWFEKSRDRILDELRLAAEPPKEMMNWIEKMHMEGSVALHVRRGDYAQPGTGEIYGVCDERYYRAAEKAILERVKSPHFFVFSDDLAWAKDNLKLHSPFTLVETQELQDHHELLLMSSCQHNIISNSTFGWWGAYLNRDPSKVVIAPERWTTPGSGMEENGVLPANWVKIP